MPIYNTDDYPQVIGRISAKLAKLHIPMGNVLPEEDILEFERCGNVTLPQAYRMFLKEVGDGCGRMIDGFRLNRLRDMRCQDLTRPFMPEEAWIWEDEEETEEALSAAIKERVCGGQIELINVGCGMSYHLIVAGKCRGEVWCFSDVGVQPCCERQDFLGWFERWLDEQEHVDYFKDYV